RMKSRFLVIIFLSYRAFSFLCSMYPYIHENECILEQIVLQLIAGYGSEENYQTVVDTFDKVPLIPYGMYHKEKSKKYASNPKHRHN
ncbi:hypothetical protein ACTMSB_14420, partial [Enterococcus faecalis]